MQVDEPRLLLAAPEPLPGWLLVARRFLRKTRRGWRRLCCGCWFGHEDDLRRHPGADGLLDLNCPRCDLTVRTIVPEVARVKPWDEAAHQRSEMRRKDRERFTNVG